MPAHRPSLKTASADNSHGLTIDMASLGNPICQILGTGHRRPSDCRYGRGARVRPCRIGIGPEFECARVGFGQFRRISQLIRATGAITPNMKDTALWVIRTSCLLAQISAGLSPVSVSRRTWRTVASCADCVEISSSCIEFGNQCGTLLCAGRIVLDGIVQVFRRSEPAAGIANMATGSEMERPVSRRPTWEPLLSGKFGGARRNRTADLLNAILVPRLSPRFFALPPVALS
jgi:hypothetical protein